MLCGVARLIANHRSSSSSKACQKSGPFPPPTLPGLTGRTALSDSRPTRRAPFWQGPAVRGGNAEGLMAKLDAARDRVAQVTGQTPKVTLCCEAGYDGFWLARFLLQPGIQLSGHGAGHTGQSQGAAREDRSHRCREYSSYADRLVSRRASWAFGPNHHLRDRESMSRHSLLERYKP